MTFCEVGTVIYFKITSNNILNCNSNKLLKVQFILQELFILAVNIGIYMYDTVNVHEFIFSTSTTSVGSVSHNSRAFKNRGSYKNGGAYKNGGLIGIGGDY